jgi:hypothetical protein
MSFGHQNGGWMNDDQRGEMREQAREAAEAAPDIEKIHALAAVLYAVEMPAVASARARMHLAFIRSELSKLGERCEAFGG